MAKTQDYGAKDIQILKGLEAVRKRPAMYIGDVGPRGLHHLVFGIVDNSIDEVLAGHGTEISVTLNEDGSCTVEDNGRGIPTGIHPTEKVSAIQVVMTVLHAGGKFDKSAYKVSGGLHGVGASVVNALSEWCIVEVSREGKVHHMEFERGHKSSDLKVIGSRSQTGTKVTFKPDTQIFPNIEFNYDVLAGRMRQLAYLNQGLPIAIRDERTGNPDEFPF